ncbi:hypothetical protein RJT34_01488 [Clitoria ternatea]|uniref:Peptidase A1 domain-containing protein n=1 Tax=Clitoria ternatea TaxID=43366 RepID=A0AAN9PZV8_CLITE
MNVLQIRKFGDCLFTLVTMKLSEIFLVILCLYNMSLSKALTDGFTIEIIHRDSAKSPFYRPTENQFQRVANAVRRSIIRANQLDQPASTSNTAQATIKPDQGEYLMSYSVGTPPFKQFGIIDTGSDIIWLQCKPCKTCYNQTTPMFNPLTSKTYKTLHCSSKECKSVKDTSCSSNKWQICKYHIDYGDGSYSKGDLSVETLTLGSTNGSRIQFPRTVIGCGRSNIVSFEGRSSGIVGLGGGPISLISRLNSSIGDKFSYCLTPMFSRSSSSSKLNFGHAAIVSGDGTVSTPIVSQDPKVFYYLTLKALSVDNNRIDIEGSSSTPRRKGNIIIDSGTTLTLLPDHVYSKFESAVADAVKLQPTLDPGKQLSLCYKIKSTGKLKLPTITAHFDGADVKLNHIGSFVEVDDGVLCLAFLPTPNGAIFGNLAQQNLLVGYDLQRKSVSFKPVDCTKQ